jgi:hypothetical protein
MSPSGGDNLYFYLAGNFAIILPGGICAFKNG